MKGTIIILDFFLVTTSFMNLKDFSTKKVFSAKQNMIRNSGARLRQMLIQFVQNCESSTLLPLTATGSYKGRFGKSNVILSPSQ